MPYIDFHTHILPGMDHGCREVEESLRQLDLLSDAGVRTVCATSHFYPEQIRTESFLKARSHAMRKLADALGNAEGLAGEDLWTPEAISIKGSPTRPEIRPGAEVLVCEGMERMEGLADLCLRGTDIILLEMPLSINLWSQKLKDTVLEIAECGLRPMMAHVDRYPRHLMQPLLEKGIRGQINADSLAHMFPPRYLLEWIENGWIVALGSDLHGADGKGMAPFIKVCKKFSNQVASVMRATDALLTLHA